MFERITAGKCLGIGLITISIGLSSSNIIRGFSLGPTIKPSITQLNLPDVEIVQAYEQAVKQNVLSAINNKVFFGYWSVCADGKDFGYGNTYPSLDGHQMTDALLWLGKVEIVKANWNYVRTFQRQNGQLPIAILPDTRDVFGIPVDPNGGFYNHWVPGDPLRALGSTTYIQNADVIFRYTQDQNWLFEQLPSINLAADFLATLITKEGRVGGAGYYLERPTRVEYDGVTQCYVADAFKRVSSLNRYAGNTQATKCYQELADRVITYFREKFWVGDHFAEYIHPKHGIISHHGLTDVDWSAIATGIANKKQQTILWSELKENRRFYYGGVPTGIATRPDTYEDWEFYHPDRHDLAAMGRVWYLECWARARMGDGKGLIESIRRVCNVGKDEGYFWRERYKPGDKGGYQGIGAKKYCEYPANLIRIIQRFLLGLELQLDGTLVLAPTASEEFWEIGFGQTLSWQGRTLSFLMKQGIITGDYSGNVSQRLCIRMYPQVGETTIQIKIENQRIKPEINDGFIFIDLYPTRDKQLLHFEILQGNAY